MPAVDPAVRLGDLVERHDAVDDRHDRTRLDELADEREVGRLLGEAVQSGEQDACAPPGLGRPRVPRPQQHRQRRHGREVDAVGRERRSALAERALADGVEDHVVAVAHLGEVLARVVDHLVGAERADEVDVVGAAHPDHGGAEVLRELHRGGPHGARRAVDEHGLPGAHAAAVAQERDRREESIEHRDGTRRVETVGDSRDQAVFGDAHAFGVRTRRGRERAVHAVARREGGDGRPHALDHAGEVVAEHRVLRPREPEVQPRERRPSEPVHGVGRADGRRLDAHEQVALGDDGFVDLADAHHIGPAVPFDHCCPHDAVSSLAVVSFGVLEHRVERDPEHPRDLEGHLERGRVPPLLDGDDGLARHAEALGEFGLGHLAVAEPQRADVVGDLRRLHHVGIPRR